MTVRTKYWLCQCAGWGAYCVIGVATTLQYTGPTVSMFVGYGLFFIYSIGMTDWFRQQIRNRRWMELPARRRIPRLVSGALLIGAVQAALVLAVDYGFRRQMTWPASDRLWLWFSTTNASLVWTFLYVQLTAGRRRQEREVRLDLALRDAELRALEAQINPHFLFNCLNSIRALVAVDPPRAQDMLTSLANVLRHSLRPDREQTVPLAIEVESVEDYLALEAVRFEQRLNVRVAIDPEAARCPVPPMLLQTLVENAIKHGIAQVTERGDLVIRAACENGMVRIEVENTGRLRDSEDSGGKVGLANARERLRLLYGDRASLNLRNERDRVRATVLIPAMPS